ncbi:MAG: pitrilysin family protein [Pseudomonadota bacterium]
MKFILSRAGLFLVLFFASVTNSWSESDTPKLQIESFALDNDLRLVVVPDRRAPVVTHMIWYGVGSADDPPGKSGVAHFLEHLLFKGTKNYPQGEFSKAVAEIGGQENAFTSHDYTAYYQRVSPDELGQMMTYEADRMRNVTLTDEVVDPEREVILEERSGRVDTRPAAILSEFTQAAIYVHHPYGIPVIGWEHEIRELKREDMLSYYEKWYQPWNAIVVVTGDVEPLDVLKLAQGTYGAIEASSPPIERGRLRDPKNVVSKSIEYKDPRVTNPVWRKQFPAPSYRLAASREAEALDLLATVLGDSVSSRIYKEVVLGAELANSAGAFYHGSSRDGGYFGLYATPRGERELSEVEAAVQAQVEMVLTDGITQEELDRARQSYLKALIYSQDSQVALARIFGSILSTGGSIEDFTGWPERLNAVTVEDVNKAARKYLDNSRAISSYLLPEEK